VSILKYFYYWESQLPVDGWATYTQNEHGTPDRVLYRSRQGIPPMIVPFSEVSVGCSLILNREAGVKVSSRTADIIVGELNGKSIWKKVWVKQKQNVVIADPDGNGIVLSW